MRPESLRYTEDAKRVASEDTDGSPTEVAPEPLWRSFLPKLSPKTVERIENAALLAVYLPIMWFARVGKKPLPAATIPRTSYVGASLSPEETKRFMASIDELSLDDLSEGPQVDASGLAPTVGTEESASRSPESNGVLRGQPKAETGDRAGYVRVDGRAFGLDPVTGADVPPHYLDVDQGNIGNCGYASSAAAIALRSPGSLVERVRQTDAGNFVVTLGDREVEVTPDFPVAGYADPTPNNQKDRLWAAVIEKAIAVLLSEEQGLAEPSYDAIAEVPPARVMQLLTGLPSYTFALQEDAAADPMRAPVMSVLESALETDRPIVIYTDKEGELPVDGAGRRLVANHGYTVLGKDEDGRVMLLNPWGVDDGRRAPIIHHVAPKDLRDVFVVVNGLAADRLVGAFVPLLQSPDDGSHTELDVGGGES